MYSYCYKAVYTLCGFDFIKDYGTRAILNEMDFFYCMENCVLMKFTNEL